MTIQSVDIRPFELHNLTTHGGELRVRPAFNKQYTVPDGYSISFAFSLISPQTNEVNHYIFRRNTTSGQTTILMTNEEFQTQTSLDIGTLQKDAVITYAVSNNAFLINSPHMASAVYGLVGGGIELAKSQPSVNEVNTSHLPEIPRGLCCSFGGRIAIADGNDVYFNDGGVEIRAFVGENVTALAGGVYEMFEGPGGALIFVTPNGSYGLPSSALDNGQEVFGSLSQVSTYSANRYRNAVYGSGQIWGLTQRNLQVITASQDVDLAGFNRKRYYTKYVGPGPLGTYQIASIWPTVHGVVISIEGKLCVVDSADMKPRWYYSDNDLTLVGMCSSIEGTDLFVFPDSICELIGNRKEQGTEIRGFACGQVPTDPVMSPVVRAITTISDNVGYSQFSFIGNRATSHVTPAPSGATTIIDSSKWDQTQNFSGRDIRSRKHFHAYRTDDFSLEVGAETPLCTLGIIDIEIKGISPMRD